MKHFLLLIALLLVPLDLQADEQTFVHIKVTYQAANGGPPAEAETDALVGDSYTRVPLKLPSDGTWIVELSCDLIDNILSAQIIDGAKVVAADYGAREGLNFLMVQTPLKFGTDIVLVKNWAYKVSVNISKVPAAGPEATGAADKEAANQPKLVPLTAEEISKLDLTYPDIPKESGPFAQFTITGHNPFEKSVEGGILEVIIPKTDSKPEIKREYAFNFNARPLADFSAQVPCNWNQFKGQKPTFTIKKLQFKP